LKERQKLLRKKELPAKDRLIISIDVNNRKDVINLCKKISGSVTTLKIGLELIYSTGPGIIDTVKSFGYRVMLDAKLLDIPNTVKGAAEAIVKLGVSAVTMHATGGKKMLEEAGKAVREQARIEAVKSPLILGVTILTSLDNNDLETLGFKEDFLNSVLNLSKIAVESGVDGIICSPNEVEPLRKKMGNDFYIATPGIRLSGDTPGDQKRINTPREAILKGADFIIVGRSITTKKDVHDAIECYLDDIERAVIND
jgi:orotidine-5'-phosphate decarboxylase